MDVDEWAIEILEELGHMEPVPTELEQRNKTRQMYIPPATVHQEEEYYDDFWPGRVALGPQFSSDWDQNYFYEMKKACLLHLLRRTGMRNPLEYYSDALGEVANELIAAYDGLDPQWRAGSCIDFLRMMLLDACFILEFMLTLKACEHYPQLKPNFNPIMWRTVENHEEMKCYLHDILLLGNQLPFNLLLLLLGLYYPGVTEDPLTFILNLIKTSITIQCLPRAKDVSSDEMITTSPLNILDLYRMCLVRPIKAEAHIFSRVKEGDHLNIYIPSATKLSQAGIRFTISESTSLLDIHFQRKTLMLPQIVVDGHTKSLFLNLIAFEQLHKDVAKNEVTSYMHFMGCLVQTADDAILLQSQGVIISTLPSAEVATVFNKISRGISIDAHRNPLRPEFVQMLSKVRERYNKMSNEWRMELFQKYLRSPWTILSIVVAVSIFALAILQTLYSMLSYYHRK
ncbi:hypothetical protein ACS0TY_006827 [Phlomoides rotata]